MAKKKEFKWPARCPIDENGWAYIQQRYHLTPRELQICVGVCRGLTHRQIAESLEIEDTTVRMYLSKIFLKVGVHTKIMLLLRFLESFEDKDNPSKTHK